MLAQFFNGDIDEGRDVGRYASTAVRVKFPHSERGVTGSDSGVPADTGMGAKNRSDADRRGRGLTRGLEGRMRVRTGGG